MTHTSSLACRDQTLRAAGKRQRRLQVRRKTEAGPVRRKERNNNINNTTQHNRQLVHFGKSHRASWHDSLNFLAALNSAEAFAGFDRVQGLFGEGGANMRHASKVTAPSAQQTSAAILPVPAPTSTTTSGIKACRGMKEDTGTHRGRRRHCGMNRLQTRQRDVRTWAESRCSCCVMFTM